MDGLAKSDALVFVLAASNIPWELDMALLRRLEKRVMVPLPDAPARHEMLRKLLEERCDQSIDLKGLAQRTEGFSGSDIKLLSKEVAMKPVRRLMRRLEALEADATRTSGKGLVSHAEIQVVCNVCMASGGGWKR